jgi:hypothetical protein
VAKPLQNIGKNKQVSEGCQQSEYHLNKGFKHKKQWNVCLWMQTCIKSRKDA